MANRIKRVLKNFTWKKFLIISLYLFVVTFLVGIFINYLDAEKTLGNSFTIKEITSRIITAFITGFILSLFIVRADRRKRA